MDKLKGVTRDVAAARGRQRRESLPPGLKKQGRKGAKEEGPLGATVMEGTADNRKAAFKLVGMLKTQPNVFFCPHILLVSPTDWTQLETREHQNPESNAAVNIQATEKDRQEIRCARKASSKHLESKKQSVMWRKWTNIRIYWLGFYYKYRNTTQTDWCNKKHFNSYYRKIRRLLGGWFISSWSSSKRSKKVPFSCLLVSTKSALF